MSDRFLVTVGVEDYFHVRAFQAVITQGHWSMFERRVEQNTRRTLDLLEQFGVHATFFVMGWVADHVPELVREIVDRGHEVATQGYLHRTIGEMSPESFREDLVRARDATQRATGRKVLGHRVPHFLGPDDLWALDVLADEGYAYDASIRPLLRRFSGERRRIHTHRTATGQAITEVPVSSRQVAGLSFPAAGGNWFRQLPDAFMAGSVARWMDRESQPFVMYFHVWELDAEQPRIQGAPWLMRQRHYRNLERMPAILEHYLTRYEGTSIARHLELEQAKLPQAVLAAASTPVPAVHDVSGPRTPVTIVVPCFNESAGLRFLANNLAHLQLELQRRYDVEVLFVDDGSTDDTLAQLRTLFGTSPKHRILPLSENQGVARAILAGIEAARTEVVCSIDCDCTYDPVELKYMIPRLVEGVDLVTGSPYHPDGQVLGVPAWRLVLSRGASWLYRRTLKQPLHTFTSCFRVYRRDAMLELELREGGFLGVAELLARVLRNGGRVVEHPATLKVRVFGQSKMKTVRAILGHLRLLTRLSMEQRDVPRSGSPTT